MYMQKYLITSQSFYTDVPSSFELRLKKQLTKHYPDFALFRDKETPHYALLAENFLKICQEFENVKAFLHRDIELAVKLKARGVHLSSDMFGRIEEAKTLGLEVVVSTHTHEEVLFAQNAGADYVTYSPVFASPGKGAPKGIEDLKRLLSKVDIKVFALGGIVNEEHLKAIEQTQAYGFASIRYFY